MEPSAQGIVAELLFAAELVKRGIHPAWPKANSPYDLVVECGGKFLRIQVKSSDRGTHIRAVRSKRKLYSKESVELLAIYLFTHRLFYLIPIEKARSNIRLKPNDPKCPWAKYKNAWNYVERNLKNE